MTIRLFGGSGHGTLIECDPCQEKYTLGRSETCYIFIDHEKLSKMHCSFLFDNKLRQWVIRDGVDLRSSTNGTWIYMSQETKIENNMTLKLSEVIYNTQTVNH